MDYSSIKRVLEKNYPCATSMWMLNKYQGHHDDRKPHHYEAYGYNSLLADNDLDIFIKKSSLTVCLFKLRC